MKTKTDHEKEQTRAAAERAMRCRAVLGTVAGREFVIELLHSPDFCALGALAVNETHALERVGQQKVGLRLLDALKLADQAAVKQMYREAVDKGMFP